MGNHEVIELLCIPYMTIMSRAHGGGWPKIPFGLDAWILALPYLLFWPVLGWWTLLGYAGAVVGIRSGHGSGFHYWDKFKKTRTVEKIEALISGALSYHVQKVLIMALTGLAVPLVCAIALAAHGFYLAGGILALSGGLKAVAYLAPKTEQSEYIRGLFLGLGVVIALVI